MLCSSTSPFVNFLDPCNPIDKTVDTKLSSRSPLKFYNSTMHATKFSLPLFAKEEFEHLLTPSPSS